MRKLSFTQQGFSAVELLITLFIAVAFIATGYQLYTIIIKDGGESRMRARASNIAYDNLRRYTPQTTDPCTVFTPTPAPSIPSGSGLANASITITITCPYTTAINITKVQVSVKYGTPQQEVVHAIFVN
jgi:Tfp pilus assembly protein PilV